MLGIRGVLVGLTAALLTIAGVAAPAEASSPAAAKSSVGSPRAIAAPASRSLAESPARSVGELAPLSIPASRPQSLGAAVQAPAVLPATSSGGLSVSLAYTVTDQVNLTATPSQAIDTTGQWLYIFDVGGSSPQLVKYCTSGSTCTVSTVPSEGQAVYQAFLSAGGVTTLPTSPAATSASVTPPAWKVTFSANVGTTIGLTATTNYSLGNAYATNEYLQIFDSANTSTSGTTYLSNCHTGTTCSITTVPHLPNTSYVAFVGHSPQNTYPMPNPVATSAPYTPPPWQVTLSASGSNITASTNYDLSGLYVEIFNISIPQNYISYLGWCTSGTSCTKSTGTPSSQFIAGVANNIQNTFPQQSPIATSNQVSAQGPAGAFETAGGSNPSEQNQCFACAGDPINTLDGEFFENSTDLSVQGRGPGLGVGRSYSSQRGAYGGSFGYGWSFSYDMNIAQPSSGVAAVTQENGSVTQFTQNSSGAYQAPSWVLAQLVHNSDGTWTFTRKAKEIFDFDSTGKLTRIRDLNGYATTIARDGQGRVASVTDSAGRSIAFAYDSNSHITSATDPVNRIVTYGYDGSGHLTSVTDPTGAVTGYAYGSFNLLTTVTDANGKTTTNAYDAANRVTSQTDRDGNKTTFSYSGSGGTLTTSTTSPAGRVTQETYTSGQRTSVTKGAGTPQAATWSYKYDPATFGITQTTDPLGKTTSAAYDANGNRTSSTDANGHTSTWTYDALDDVTSSTDALGVTTTYTYDAAGNPLTKSTPLTGGGQATTTLAYADSTHPGDLTSSTDPDGHATAYTYDAAGDRASVKDPLGNTTSYTYDAIGRMLTSKTPLGNTTTNAYDADSRITSVTDPLGHTTTYGYDPTGLRTTVTDALNHTTTTAYDPMGHPVKVTNPDGTFTTTAYDADGNTTSTTDANGKSIAYAYNALDRVTSATDPLNRVTAYAYDGAGHLTGTTNPAGQTATNTYDPAGNKTGTTYSDGTTHAESYTYTADNQQATMAGATGTTTSTYDSLGRLTAQTNGNGQAIGYTWDPAGELTAIAYPNGQSVTRAYDTAGRLTGITDWAGHTTTFAPDADGNTSSTAYANGVTAAASYDATGALASITDTGPGNTALASFAYTRNPVNDLTATNVTGITAPNETYTYSSLNQLTGVNTSTYSYDASGNPTALASGATLAYDAASQPTTYTVGGTTTNLAYDAQGNRTSGPGPNGTTAAYTWDQANRLTSASGATATYDPTGLRATRTPAGGATSHYAWDTLAAVPLMLSDGSTSYLYDDAGNPVEQIDSTGAALYYQHDQYGSTRVLTDATGALGATYTYDAYGNLTAKTGTADTPLRWDGQIQDEDTGLYYLRARYYDPQTSQFLSTDPLRALTRSSYGYVSGDPLNSIDPLGLGPCGLFQGLCDANQYVERSAVSVEALVPYAAYYVTYRTQGSIGNSLPGWANDAATQLENEMLNEDQAFDGLKRAFGAQEGINDEGGNGGVLPFHIPGIDKNPGDPLHTYLPGVDENGCREVGPNNYGWDAGWGDRPGARNI